MNGVLFVLLFLVNSHFRKFRTKTIRFYRLVELIRFHRRQSYFYHILVQRVLVEIDCTLGQGTNMGAAASVQHLYFDSFKWFQQYIDNEVYHSDYDELDKDHDGAVSFGELQKYIKKKASVPDSPWKMFKTSSPVGAFL